jgi:hypothetical protein
MGLAFDTRERLMKKATSVFLGLAAILVIALAFLPTPGKTLIEDFFVQPTYNSLSGREGSDGPILAVKIDDTVAARPQIGLDRADIVYIEQVEGGLTRLAAIFSSEIPQLIGPIRSARITDIEVLSQYGTVVFAYSGAQSKFLPVIRAANLHDYGAQRQSPTIYTRDGTRFSPTNMVLRADLLMEKVKADEKTVSQSSPNEWTFGDKPEGGNPISEAKVMWPATTYEFRWSAEENRWTIFNNGIANLSASGAAHSPTTIVIQKVQIVPSIYGDKFGGVTPHSLTIGSGTGFVLRDGQSFSAMWSRPDAQSGTTWVLPDGTPLNFARGQVWVALVEKDPVFTARLTTLTE